jgi:2-polyprenyl-6-methoxyphenol hydroxylase-like FAD-dependent oxidoreductase
MHEAGEPRVSEPYAAPLMVPQWKTEEILRKHLLALGYAPEFGTELVSFEQDHDSVHAVVRTADGERAISAQYLVGCDGGRSFVRQALALDFPGTTQAAGAIVADLKIEGLSRDAWHMWPKAAGGQLAL